MTGAERRKLNLNSLQAWFIGGLKDKWRLAFLAFAVAYLLVLVFSVGQMNGLSNMSIQWDEVTHLNGGVLLLHGDFQTYFSFNAFYPPMYDTVTMVFFGVGGVSVFMGRFVSVVFSVLSLYAVFEFVYRMYGQKTALLSSVLLAIMPGYLWLSRMAMIETMLVFFFTVSTLFFFFWLREHKNKFLILSGLALGLGILTKYQMIIVGAIMLTSLVVLGRGYLKKKFTRFPLLIITVVAVTVPCIIISYQIYASGMLDQWIYALQIGNPEKLLYSTGLDRLPQWFGQLPSWLQLPLFYSVEVTWPYSDVHPISLYLYGLGLLGLGLFAWRRKTEDKFLLIWFFIVYIFFTLISNKQWRYMIPVFPVLAISAASFIMLAFGKAEKTWKSALASVNKKRAIKVAAGLFAVFLVTSVYLSLSDAQYWVAKDNIYVPIEEATNYAASRLAPNESIMVVCAQKLFSQDMVRFYLYQNGLHNEVWQYPALPVDTYTPNFNVTEFIGLCEQHNVKYVFTYEFGGTVPYFNTTLSLHEVYMMLSSSDKFGGFPLPNNATFGVNPRRIFILTFLS